MAFFQEFYQESALAADRSTFSPTEAIAAAKGNVARGIQRAVYAGLAPRGQWLWRALERVEGGPHAATTSNGYELY